MKSFLTAVALVLLTFLPGSSGTAATEQQIAPAPVPACLSERDLGNAMGQQGWRPLALMFMTLDSGKDIPVLVVGNFYGPFVGFAVIPDGRGGQQFCPVLRGKRFQFAPGRSNWDI